MRLVALSEISDLIDYGVTASASAEAVGPKFLRITDIQDGSVNWDQVPYCEGDARKLRSSRLLSGDIVFARTGATTGKSFLVRSCPDNAVFASYLIRVRPSPAVHPEFLAQFFDSQSYWDQIRLKSAGATQPGVNASKLAEIEIPLPPLDEQKRIAAILDQADALRRLRTRALDRLNALGQAIFYEMFGKRLTDAGSSQFMTIGSAISSGLIADQQDGNHGERHPKVSDFAEAPPDGVPFIMANCFKNGELDLPSAYKLDVSWLKKLRVGFSCPGDVLLTHKGTVGEVAVVRPEHGQIILSPQVTYYRSAIGLMPEYLAAYFRSARFQQRLKKDAIQSTRAYIGLRGQRELPLFVPSMEDQQAFVRRVGSILIAPTYGQEASSALLQTLFTALQHRAFRGEL